MPGEKTKQSVVEWSSTIYAIAWSVWWTSFISEWINSQNTNINIFIIGQVPIILALIINSLLFGIYVFFYVRWLWKVSSWGKRTTVVRFFREFWPGMTLSFATFIGLIINHYNNGLAHDNNSIAYSISLTIIWILLPGLQAIFTP